MSIGTLEWYEETARRIVELANSLQYENAYALLRTSWIAEDGEVPSAFLDATHDAQQAFHGGPEIKRGGKTAFEYNHNLFMKAIATLENWILDTSVPSVEIQEFLGDISRGNNIDRDTLHLDFLVRQYLSGDLEGLTPPQLSHLTALEWLKENLETSSYSREIGRFIFEKNSSAGVGDEKP